jgi:DNA polymerase III sliding clamp (beta) subunit (PCNA family)
MSLLTVANQFPNHETNKPKVLGLSHADVNPQLRNTNSSSESQRWKLGNKNLFWNFLETRKTFYETPKYTVSLWELGHQLQQSDVQRPLSVMKKVRDT